MPALREIGVRLAGREVRERGRERVRVRDAEIADRGTRVAHAHPNRTRESPHASRYRSRPRNALGSLALLAVLLGSGLARAQPVETGGFREPDLVELRRLDASIHLDIRYASKNNFTKRQLYKQARAFLQRPAAVALLRAHQALKAQGYGLLIYDGYRPWSVTKLFWDVTPEDKHKFVANPQKGSRHNRGCAVDVGLFDRRTGKEVPMPSVFDEMSERAAADFPGGSEKQRRTRALLRAALEAEGFKVNPDEWWHFDYRDWSHYRVLDLDFEEVSSSKQ